MFPRTLFPSISDSPLFRDPVRRFMETNVMPHNECREPKGCVDRRASDKMTGAISMSESGAGSDMEETKTATVRANSTD